MDKSFANVCRLCMNYASTDIFAKGNTPSIYIKINLCLDLKICPGDGLPANICDYCESQINYFFEFKEKCSRVDDELRSYLEITTKENFDNSVNLKNNLFTVENEGPMSKIAIKKEIINDDDDDDDEQESLLKPLKSSTKCQPKRVIVKRKKKNVKNKLKLQCEFCGKVFSKKHVLRMHMGKHMPLKYFYCDICNNKFTRRSSLVVHKRIHTDERPFTCDICSKSTRKKQDLIRHMKIHNDIKDYPCCMCQRRFKRSHDVRTHMRIHTGAKPYQCDKCLKCYRTSGALAKHRNSPLCKQIMELCSVVPSLRKKSVQGPVIVKPIIK